MIIIVKAKPHYSWEFRSVSAFNQSRIGSHARWFNVWCPVYLATWCDRFFVTLLLFFACVIAQNFLFSRQSHRIATSLRHYYYPHYALAFRSYRFSVIESPIFHFVPQLVIMACALCGCDFILNSNKNRSLGKWLEIDLCALHLSACMCV